MGKHRDIDALDTLDERIERPIGSERARVDNPHHRFGQSYAGQFIVLFQDLDKRFKGTREKMVRKLFFDPKKQTGVIDDAKVLQQQETSMQLAQRTLQRSIHWMIGGLR